VHPNIPLSRSAFVFAEHPPIELRGCSTLMACRNQGIVVLLTAYKNFKITPSYWHVGGWSTILLIEESLIKRSQGHADWDFQVGDLKWGACVNKMKQVLTVDAKLNFQKE
jgi:uncharacterized membrane protein